jgi:uncharacterized membrane protein
MKNILFYCLVVVVFLSQCKKKETSKTSAYTPNCNGTPLFANNVLPIIQSNCVGCHSSYNTYSGIKANVSAIRSEVVSGSMPKGGSLTTDQKNAIVCWIDGGVPNN